ncbi:GGDEF domain-containing protein [Bacillus sp. BGMRC 2118]|nr:GGDEF domain-containing protein [Bacillus sp. BGMRC 2118]
MQTSIGEITDSIKIVTPSTKCEYVYSLFKDEPALEGIVVCFDNQPVGLVMKTQFYQKLSTKYGFDLFMKRTIDLVMNKEPLIVDYSVPISEVSARAMLREQEFLYDYVIVTKVDQLIGIVSIKNLLMKLAEVQIKIARYSNPLTGLPGNVEIERALQEALKQSQYSVFYIDINAFKVFNDTYGFKLGDEVIKETGKIISEEIDTSANQPCFVGHIGGDDFVGILPHYSYQDICQSIINRFDQLSIKYYSPEELKRGYVNAMNRAGILENMPLISLSISVVHNNSYSFNSVEELSKVSADLKRKCKAFNRSVCLTIDEALENSFV